VLFGRHVLAAAVQAAVLLLVPIIGRHLRQWFLTNLDFAARRLRNAGGLSGRLSGAARSLGLCQISSFRFRQLLAALLFAEQFAGLPK
jgi:hypothetical protein